MWVGSVWISGQSNRHSALSHTSGSMFMPAISKSRLGMQSEMGDGMEGGREGWRYGCGNSAIGSSSSDKY